MRLLWIWGGVLAAVLQVGGAAAADLRSEYTDLDFAQCTTIEADDTGSMSACPGLRGYPVVVGEGDLRMFVSFGIDAGSEPAMNQTMSPFNHLGKKIEWLVDASDVDNPQPRATILRWFTAGEDGTDKGQVLVVTQIKPGATCQMAWIDARKPAASAPGRAITTVRRSPRPCSRSPPFEAAADQRFSDQPLSIQPLAIWLRRIVRWRAETPISSAMRQTMLSSSSWFCLSA